MLGVQSGAYAALCTSIEDHVTAFKKHCNYSNGTYFMGQWGCGTDPASNFNITDPSLCRKWNPNGVNNFDGNGYCPDGANGTTCACKKGTNWRTANQKCQTSR